MSDSTPPSQQPGPGPADTDTSEPDDAGGRGSGPRSALLIAGAVALVLVAGAAVVVMRLLGGGGTQPAAVLPDDAILYVGVDLDPPAGQKIAAYQFLRSFPDLRGETPEDDEDPREKLVRFLLDEADCDEASWAEDVEPWLGERAALVVRPGQDEPVPVFVLQVSDEDAARDGIAALDGCDGSTPEEPSGVAFSEGYAVLAETQAQADAAVEATASGALSDDADFTELTAAAGQDGIVEAYFAPSFLDELTALADLDEEFSADDLEVLKKLYGDDYAFAATLRFEGGGVELVAAQPQGEVALAASGGAQLASLPADSLLAMAGGIPDGLEDLFATYEDLFTDGFESVAGEGEAPDFVQLLEDETGLRLPEDLRTLVGSRAALSVGDDVIADFTSDVVRQTPPPLAIGVLTDSEESEVQDVVDKLNAVTAPLTIDVASGDLGTSYALDPAWAERLATGEGDTLADSQAFADVVGDLGGSSFGLFVNLNGDWTDDLRAQLSDDEAEVFDDVFTPLSGVGAVTRVEGDLQVSRIRVGTD